MSHGWPEKLVRDPNCGSSHSLFILPFGSTYAYARAYESEPRILCRMSANAYAYEPLPQPCHDPHCALQGLGLGRRALTAGS